MGDGGADDAAEADDDDVGAFREFGHGESLRERLRYRIGQLYAAQQL